MKKAKSKSIGLKVLNDRVLIKPNEATYQGASKEVTKALESGKLVLPESYEAFYKNLPDTGTIVGIGDGCKGRWVIGDKVHFAKMAGAKLKHENADYIVLREYDIDLRYETVD